MAFPELALPGAIPPSAPTCRSGLCRVEAAAAAAVAGMGLTATELICGPA